MAHWYDQKGNTAYEVMKADGKGLRATTLRDARKHNLVPSVTTVIACAAKPGLEKWKVEQAIKTAKEFPIFKGEPEEVWIKRISYQAQELGKKAADRGTEIHDALEKYFLQTDIDNSLSPFVTASAMAIAKIDVEEFDWYTERSFSHKDGFGGKVDLSSCKGYIVDFKTKSTDIVNEKCVYDEHAMQLAAYRKGLDLPSAKCYNLFISTTKPGEVYLHEWKEEDIIRGEKMFYALLNYWKVLNKFGE